MSWEDLGLNHLGIISESSSLTVYEARMELGLTEGLKDKRGEEKKTHAYRDTRIMLQPMNANREAI